MQNSDIERRLYIVDKYVYICVYKYMCMFLLVYVLICFYKFLHEVNFWTKFPSSDYFIIFSISFLKKLLSNVPHINLDHLFKTLCFPFYEVCLYEIPICSYPVSHQTWTWFLPVALYICPLCVAITRFRKLDDLYRREMYFSQLWQWDF